MRSFSASDAALDGLRVIREHWRLVLGWAVFHLLAIIIMIVVSVVIAVGLAEGGAGDPRTVGAQAGGLISVLGALLTETLIAGAFYRAVMRGGPPGFFHLRIGPDELRLFVVGLVGLLIFLVLSAVTMAVGAAAGVLWGLAAAVAALGAASLLLARFYLAGPIVIAERRIGLGRSWRMTRGSTWPLVGVLWLALALVMLISLTLWLTVGVVAGLFLGLRGFSALFTGGEGGWVFPLLQVLLQLVTVPLTMVLWLAPTVAAYRGLKAGE